MSAKAPTEPLNAPDRPGLWHVSWRDDAGNYQSADLEVQRLGGQLVILRGMVLDHGWKPVIQELRDHPGRRWTLRRELCPTE